MSKIDAYKLIESGLETVQFDASKVKLAKNVESTSDWNNEATKYVAFTYDDKELGQLALDNHYSFQWGETKVTNNSTRGFNSEGLILSKTVKSTLRKRPNKDEYTQKSLDNHFEKVEKRLDGFDFEYATEQFRLAVEHFNQWYVEKQKEEVSRVFGGLGCWKFDQDQDIQDMTSEIKELEEKLQILRQKKFERQYDIVISYVEKEDSSIHEDFRISLADSMQKNKQEGYKNPFFR